MNIRGFSVIIGDGVVRLANGYLVDTTNEELLEYTKGEGFIMENRIVDRPIREASEAHVALSLVLDVSASMQGDSIKFLNIAVNEMIRQMKADDHLRNIVDLAIFIFGTHGRQNILQGFRAIADCDDVNLIANDVNTYVADALDHAIEITKRRCSVYDKAGGSYKPWIVLITDGEFHDGAAALGNIGNKMRERESQGKLQFFGLGVNGYIRSQLEGLTTNPSHVIDAKSVNFIEFFSWIGKSLKAVSSKEIGENVSLPPLQFTV